MYESFAQYYDELMDANYPEWIDAVSRFLTGKKGVDLACGTGKFTLGLIAKGFDVTGVDLSAEMLSRARDNALSMGIKAEFIQMNMIDFVPFEKQDFCICMCDGVNYLSAPEKLFSSVASYLKKEGIFIFDLSTCYRIENILSGRTFSETYNDITYIWRNEPVSGRKLKSELIFFAPDGNGRYIKTKEYQTMYKYDETKIVSLLKDRGFSISVYGDNLLSRKKATSQRIHFVCKKIKE